jgi:hypothetical protein
MNKESKGKVDPNKIPQVSQKPADPSKRPAPSQPQKPSK